MLSRKQYIEICEVCVKKKFDKNKGIVCSLTNEHAEFEDSCPDFLEDPKALHRRDRFERSKNEIGQADSDAVWIAWLLDNGVKGGIIAMSAGAVWLTVSFYFNQFSIIGCLIFIFGVGIVIAALYKIYNRRKAERAQQDVLDRDLDIN